MEQKQNIYKKFLRPWVVLKHKIKKQDKPGIIQFLKKIEPSEKARALSRLERDHQVKLLTLLEPHEAAELLADIPTEQAADLMEVMPKNDASEILDQMPINEQADLLGDMDLDDANAILQSLPQDEADKTRQILKYPENTAGGIMITEFLSYREDLTVGDVVHDLEKNGKKYSDYNVQYSYIVDVKGKLIGVLRLRDLLLSSRDIKINNLLLENPTHVQVDTPLDDLIQIFEDNNFIGIPVVDYNHVLLGVVRRYEVEEAAGDRDKDTYLKTSGIVGGEELRTMPVWDRSRRRLSWLFVSITLNLISASVISAYQETLSAVIALAIFLPMISDMSGCSGNQAVAVSIRELTLGLVKPYEILRVLFKEMIVGVINGLVLGLLLGTVAFIWKGNFYLGVIVGGALALNAVVAVSLGGIIPLILKRFGKDPALASGPILTTCTDMCGFFLALNFATILLPHVRNLH